ncbi:MAG: hypothetical protein VX834_10795 [Myxococcota bacterium]|nr:hypothetical protein [Myxococcota bacterium]
MNALNDVLLEQSTRDNVITDCVALVETEIQSKSGLSGVAIKTAFGVVHKVNPKFVHLAVSSLIDDFVKAMNPVYDSYKETGRNDLRSYWIQEKGALANSLLQVADRRMDRAQNKAIKKVYAKLRPTGLKHVEASVPAIADVISKYVS